MLFIYIGHTYFFTRFRQFIMSYKNHFVVSQMLYLIFFMGKKPRENYCNGKIKKKRPPINSLTVLKYMDIVGIIHFTNIYWDHIIFQTLGMQK